MYDDDILNGLWGTGGGFGRSAVLEKQRKEEEIEGVEKFLAYSKGGGTYEGEVSCAR